MRGWIAGLMVCAAACGGPRSTTPSAAPTATVIATPSATPTPTGEAVVGESASESASASESESESASESESQSTVVSFVDANPSTSTSIGGPNEGRLTGGVPLPRRAPGLERNPRRPNHDAYYGTYELVRSLVDGAAIVRRDLPGGTLTINDIGLREGGTIAHHGSHRAGRDVDVLFYMLDPEGQPRASMAVPIEIDGSGTDYGDLVDPADDVPMQIDIARTWRLVQALVEDDDALVQRIFVVEHVRTMLLAEAARVHAPRAAIRRFEEVSCQPGYPHDDHLHVRYFCTNEDLGLGCEDAPPIYPWRREQLSAADLEPVIAHPRRRSRETAATSPPDGTPMDDAVRAFLARRDAWASQPHPGRPYCR